MRKALIATVVMALAAGVASAQWKENAASAPAPSSPSGASPLVVPGAVKQQQALSQVRRINVREALKLQKEGKAVLVDVRSNEQFRNEHIKGAYNLPGSQLIRRLAELPPGKTIITYCACTAEQSSGRAVLDLNAHGVKHAGALLGGIAKWREAGLPTANGDGK